MIRNLFKQEDNWLKTQISQDMETLIMMSTILHLLLQQVPSSPHLSGIVFNHGVPQSLVLGTSYQQMATIYHDILHPCSILLDQRQMWLLHWGIRLFNQGHSPHPCFPWSVQQQSIFILQVNSWGEVFKPRQKKPDEHIDAIPVHYIQLFPHPVEVQLVKLWSLGSSSHKHLFRLQYTC